MAEIGWNRVIMILTMMITLTRKAMSRLEKQMLANSRLVVLSCTKIVNVFIFTLVILFILIVAIVIVIVILILILILTIIIVIVIFTCRWSWLQTELTTIRLPKMPTTEQEDR